MFHTISSRGAAKARLARRPKRFRTGLYEDILSGEEREANAARRACSQPQQKACEISGLEASGAPDECAGVRPGIEADLPDP